MKKLLMTAMILLASLTVSATISNAQETRPSPSAADVMQIRLAYADRDDYKKRLAESEREKKEIAADRDAWKASSEKWQKLSEAETKRADEVQGKRIGELEKAYDEEKQANYFLRQQTKDDGVKISELNFDVRKYKGQRKYYFLGGFATGSAVGGYAGYKLGRRFGFSVKF